MAGTELILIYDCEVEDSWASVIMIEDEVQSAQEGIPESILKTGRCSACSQRVGKLPKVGTRGGGFQFVQFSIEMEILEPQCLPCTFKACDAVMTPQAFDECRKSVGRHKAASA
jgi:hypothetical protein